MLHSIKNIVLLEPKDINILFNCEVFGLLYLIVTKTYSIIIHDNDIKKMETNYMTLSKLINKPIHCIIYTLCNGQTLNIFLLSKIGILNLQGCKRFTRYNI